MPFILVFSISVLTAKFYVANGTIKIIIKNFILALKNATLASKLKIKNIIKNQKSQITQKIRTQD